MLEVKDLHSFYGDAHVLHGVTLTVSPSEVVALLGRNGMGKTTLIRSIMRLAEWVPGETSAFFVALREAHRTSVPNAEIRV